MSSKDTYIDKASFFYGKCKVCGKEADGKKTKAMVKVFAKINHFRGDDQEIACWCRKCYDSIEKETKVILRLCKLMRPQERWFYREEDETYVADAIVLASAKTKTKKEILGMIAYNREQFYKAIAALDKILIEDENCTDCTSFKSFAADYCDDTEPSDQGFCLDSNSPYYGNQGAGIETCCKEYSK